MLYLTDDWVSGARLLGLSTVTIQRRLRQNVGSADIVGAVTPGLLTKLRTIDPNKPSITLPNACEIPVLRPLPQWPSDLPYGPSVGLVGQLNERIDVQLLESISDAGMPLVVIGPMTAKDPSVIHDFETLFERDNVRWLGLKTSQDLPAYISRFKVGITPYRINAFNNHSFPLKTLEYLSYGLPAVATDLPASRFLSTGLIDIAQTGPEFVSFVRKHWGAARDTTACQARRDFARTHSWGARADQLIAALNAHTDFK
ncbi:glycosyltransferase [Ornithinicoccus hortensis]